ncbi:MAG: DnaJ domain-containing protein, partial [Microcystaceae cyanobacterium]
RAYKNLIRMWHPDVNKHPQATQMTSLINVAYEKYQSLQRVSSISPKTIVVNQTLLIKIRGWIKPLFR